MAKSVKSGKEALDELRKLMIGLEGQDETVRKVLALLGAIEEELQRAAVSIPAARRGKSPLTYVVEQTGLGETLAEHRPQGSSQPFRCPKNVFDAIIEVLVERDEPLSAEVIAEAVEKRTGTRPGNHQFRVPLRLLTQIDPPLLTRTRAKYTPAGSGDFAKAAEDLWGKLKAR